MATKRQHETVTDHTSYGDIVAALADSGLVARGGFQIDPDEQDDTVRNEQDEQMDTVRTVVLIGNVGSAMWPKFTSERTPGPDPLDRWTRQQLIPIAESLGASYVHPSDEPFHPFQRWAQRGEDVWSSPIGLLIHRDHGLWHAYRGAFLFDHEITDLPTVGLSVSPCLSCADQPCLSACPVDAFGTDASGVLTYDVDSCRSHIAGEGVPQCGSDGCAARCACPINADGKYNPEQMAFHMAAFVGLSTP